MKKILLVLMILGFAASLGAQSLVELAKQEKARRQSLGRHAVVVDNRALLQVKKTPAVEVVRPEGMSGEEAPADAASIPEDAGLAPSRGGEPETPPQVIAGQNAPDEIPQDRGALEDALEKVDQLVENLTTEMNSLRQQYEAQNTMVPGTVIQQQMQETNQRLSQAQMRQAQILEKLGRPVPPIKKEPGGQDR